MSLFAQVAYKLFGSSNERALKSLSKEINKINGLEPEVEKLSDTELKNRTPWLRERLQKGESLDDILPDAFATVREAAKRTLGQRHFDVQLMGGMVLHQGRISEMRTGEGKTLCATLPVYLNAIEGKGVHVVTVNDYLAKRDAEWMSKVYNFLGLTVGVILHDLDDSERRKAYACDITYGTNNEFGFDYLRDNMKFRLEEMAQREFNFAIVDEVDSILIDEARTPLIISGPSQDNSELYTLVNRIIPRLVAEDYEKDEKVKTVTLTETGVEHIEELLRADGLLTEGNLYDAHNISLVHHANQALRAHKLFAADVDYIVKDDKVVIIDEFTGRMMEGRRYSEGLHQALEAKEGVKIQNENQTLASITFQNYFRLYPKLAGMTGTAMTEATEFGEIYKLDVMDIPTNVSCIRKDHNDEIYRTSAEKFEAISNLILECRDREQPVLVGTTSIEKSELLSNHLKKLKIPHNVLNARYHEQEAQIIAQAGRPGAVTIATNMAGRGTDIQLGGNAEMRIAQEIPSGVDEATRKHLAEKIRQEVAEAKKTVLESGGLYVIGTERHESRRIDNQLRGRSGRQGDPGASKFFMSLEDDLMRIFGSERMDSFLERMGLKPGEAIFHPWINKAIERAQAKVEGQHFEIRKNLLKFDDVMNDQRKVIYDQRKTIMATQDSSALLSDMRIDVIESVVHRCIPLNSYAEQWDMDLLRIETQRLLGLELPFAEWGQEEGIAETEIADRMIEAANKKMAEKSATMGPELMRRLEKAVLLQTLDQTWKEHLLNLDHLRQGINLRAFGQRDPLNEFKREAFAMFEDMLNTLREKVTSVLSIVEFNPDQPMPVFPKLQNRMMKESRGEDALVEPRVATFQNPDFNKNDPATWGKTPRNSACPCGSGIKYKHCHGKVA